MSRFYRRSLESACPKKEYRSRPRGSAPKTREEELEERVRKLEAQVAYLKKSIAQKAELGLLPGRGPRP